MKDHLAALRRAQGAILIAHMFKTAFALLVLGGFGVDVAGVASQGDLVALATLVIEEAPRQSAAAQWTVCGYALVGPMLTQFVLAALLGRGRPKTAALWRYHRALGLGMLRLTALGAAAFGTFGACTALAASVPPALETTARFASLALGACLFAWLATAHDLAAAQLALSERPRVWSAARRAAAATSPRTVAVHLAFALGGGLAFAAGEAAARTLWPALSVALSQAFALAVAFVDAAWLGYALARINQHISAGLNSPALNDRSESTGL